MVLILVVTVAPILLRGRSEYFYRSKIPFLLAHSS